MFSYKGTLDLILMEFPKTDDKIINEKYIRWIKKVDECLLICTKWNGCEVKDTHKICKLTFPYSYHKDNDAFKMT